MIAYAVEVKHPQRVKSSLMKTVGILKALLIILFISIALFIRSHIEFKHVQVDVNRGATNLQADTIFNLPSKKPKHIAKQDGASAFGPEKATVVVSTYKSPNCLMRHLQHWPKCHHIVAELRINWYENLNPEKIEVFQPLLKEASRKKFLIKFDKYDNKLSNRFYPRNFTTNAVFTVDVDTLYSCEAVKMAVDVWKKTGTNSLVGFHPREVQPDMYTMYLNIGGDYDSDRSYRRPFPFNTLLLTKGGVTSKSMFNLYFQPKYKKLRRRVDRFLTGEDLLMSFVQILESMKLKANVNNVALICLNGNHACHLDAKKYDPKYNSLLARSFSKRAKLLKYLFKKLGNPFRFRGNHSNRVIWQDSSLKKGDTCTSIPTRGVNYLGTCSDEFSLL
eukprot:g8363.t1